MTHSDTLFETAYKANRHSAPRTLPIDRAPSMKRLMATLTAGLTALSLMVATALPAHADRQSDNLAKVLVAAVAVGAIVHAIDKGKAKPAPIQVRSPAVPSVCAIQVSGARHERVFYTERCLRSEGFKYRLPRDCAVNIRTRGRTDRAYGERCLRDAGFRIGGRHDRREERLDDWRLDDRGGHGGGRKYGRGQGYGY